MQSRERTPKTRRRATILDVVRETGFSLSTVSNALSGKAHVRDETRAKVQSAAARLGYSASPVARGLRMQRTYIIGVLVADISNPVSSAFVRGIEDVAIGEGYDVLLCNTDGSEDRQVGQMRTLLGRQVDGMVLISQHCNSQRVRDLLESGVPSVLVQRRGRANLEDYVGVDNRSGVFEAVSKLVELGHRRIAFVQGPEDSSTAMERLRSFRDATVKFKLHPDRDLIYPGDYSLESGRAAAVKFLAMRDPPTAILASDDINALGVLEAAADRGVAVPTDLSVIGYDDIELASLAAISLSTLHLPKREMGAAAAELLIKRITQKRNAAPKTVIFPSRLIVRRSLGPSPLRKKVENEAPKARKLTRAERSRV